MVDTIKFCFLVCGSSGSGKSTYIKRVTTGKWDQNYIPTGIQVESVEMIGRLKIGNKPFDITYKFVEIPGNTPIYKLPDITEEYNKIGVCTGIICLFVESDVDSIKYVNEISRYYRKYYIQNNFQICSDKNDTNGHANIEAINELDKLNKSSKIRKKDIIQISSKSKHNLQTPYNNLIHKCVSRIAINYIEITYN